MALKACELPCIASFVYEYLSQSQGKLALKSQGKSGIFVRAYSWEPCNFDYKIDGENPM